jgi:multidrug efflux pump subunit AcrA (membrane-fusion protein)
MKTRPLLAVLVLALVIGAGLAVQHKRAAVAAWPAAGVPPLVAETRELAAGPVSLTLPATAEVQPVREAVLASRYSAYVIELDYFEGDRFRQGEVLARLDMSQVEADLTRAEAQLAQSRLQANTLAAELVAAKSLVMSEEARVARLQALLKRADAGAHPTAAGGAAVRHLPDRRLLQPGAGAGPLAEARQRADPGASAAAGGKRHPCRPRDPTSRGQRGGVRWL